MSSTLEWLTLHLISGLGAAGCLRLVDTFGSPRQALKASRKDLQQVKGLRAAVIETIVNKPPLKEAEGELVEARKRGVSVLVWDDPAYPSLLRNIYNPPMVLYVKGDPQLLAQAGLAVVGSRAATIYGLKIGRQISQELAASGVVVISGLALGIDAAAHAGALEAQGSTVAVLGCGLDIQYPRRNLQLAKEIARRGALVSEYPFGTEPEAFRFPARNRIISGLALGVLVIEAAARSGSLITARLALEEGRDVFAIPGRVDSAKSAGTHRLLQDGAKLVQSVDDILEEMPGYSVGQQPEMEQNENSPNRQLSGEELKMMRVLDSYPKHIDAIIEQTELPASKVSELLLLLELQGLVESSPGQNYRAV